MPLTVADGALLGTGMLFVSGATLAYRRKQTAAFKALYFLSWPTLGSALLWTCMPSKERMEQVCQGVLLEGGRVRSALFGRVWLLFAVVVALRSLAGWIAGNVVVCLALAAAETSLLPT
jgi:hypothetical protein